MSDTAVRTPAGPIPTQTPNHIRYLPLRIIQRKTKRSRAAHGRLRSVPLPVWMLATCILVVEPGLGQAVPEAPRDSDATEVVQSVPDSLLAGRLRTIFSNVDEFGDVTVAVTEGVVRLGGSVGQPEMRRRAEELASSLVGVVYVVNDVEASMDVETRLSPAVAKIQEFWDGFVSQLPVIAVALLVILTFALVSVVIGRWRRPARWTGINPLMWGFLSRLFRTILVLIGLVLAFDILGIASLMGAVLGAAGIIGLALGFAFQDIVENYLAGMLLSLRRPFSVNDLVRIGEFEGRIVRLTSRELVLLTLEGNHVRLPNAHVFKNPLTNFTINPTRLFSFDVAISLEEDPQEAISVGVDALDIMIGVMREPPPFGRVMQILETSLIVRYHGWVNQLDADFYKVRSEAIRIVKAALDDASIELPAPTYRVHMETTPKKAPRVAPGTREQTAGRDRSVDVRPDGRLEAQVREELDRSDDENLLK